VDAHCSGSVGRYTRSSGHCLDVSLPVLAMNPFAQESSFVPRRFFDK